MAVEDLVCFARNQQLLSIRGTRRRKQEMRVTVFNGSPRGRKSNTHRIVEPLLHGAREAGAQTEEVFLIERDIQHCRGCFTCWTKTPGKCVIKDEMSELMDLFIKSDYIGLATPVYGMYMTGLLKNFTDRFLPLSTPHIRKSEDGSFYHEGRIKKFPRQFFVANAGFPGGHNFDLLKAATAQQQFVLEVYRNCGEILNDAEPDERISQFYAALRDAGRELIVKGCVSEETVKKVHVEIISDEEYMQGANQHWDQELGNQS